MYRLQVMTPEETIFNDEVVDLIAPGENGYLGVLTNHAPLLSSLKAGILIITDKSKKQLYYEISTGFLEVHNNKASIIVETIQPTAPVDIGTHGGI